MTALVRVVAAASLALLASAQAYAAPVTWGISATYVNGATVSGTVTLDDSSIQGLYDGSDDPFDTHVSGRMVLTSSAFGMINTVFDPIAFQPFSNTTYGDGPHFDSDMNFGSYWFSFSEYGAQVYDVSRNEFISGSWAFDRNPGSNDVPEPASLALMGLGIAGLAASRRRRQP